MLIEAEPRPSAKEISLQHCRNTCDSISSLPEIFFLVGRIDFNILLASNLSFRIVTVFGDPLTFFQTKVEIYSHIHPKKCTRSKLVQHACFQHIFQQHHRVINNFLYFFFSVAKQDLKYPHSLCFQKATSFAKYRFSKIYLFIYLWQPKLQSQLHLTLKVNISMAMTSKKA